MTIYSGGDISKIYLDNVKIKEVYYGADKVFSCEKYNPGTVLINTTLSNAVILELDPGVYYVDVTGGGGPSAAIGMKGSFSVTTGSGGGSCYGNFYLKEKAVVELKAGVQGTTTSGGENPAVGSPGYVKINSVNFLVANSGNIPGANPVSGGSGVVSDLEVVENKSLKAVTGGTSIITSGNAPVSVNSVSPHGWGKASSGSTAGYADGSYGWDGQPGGVFLQYVGAK